MATRPAMTVFETRIKRDDVSGCWLWQAKHFDRDGYGIFHIDGRKHPAHRASWLLHRGPIDTGLYVLHHCDRPECVNPEHLFLGTQLDNMRDMHSKGRDRGRIRENHHRARLTREQVDTMRALRAGGMKLKELSRRYGVGIPNVSAICTHRYWKD